MSRLNRVVVAAVLVIGVMFTGGVVGANPQPAPRGVCTKVGQVVSGPVRLVCKQTVNNGLRWRKTPITTTTTPIAPSSTVAVVPTVSLAATFLDSGTFPKAAVVTSNVAGTVYFIEGASPVNTVSDITSARVYRWTSGVVAANTPTSIALDVDVLTNGYYRVFVANSQGVLSAPAHNKVTISISRVSDVVALTCATGGACAIGDTGPGGGKVFYVSATNFTSTGSDCGTTCKYLEAAPSDQSSGIAWCSNTTSALGTTGTAIGTGMANTTTADTTCTTGAIQIATDYTNNSKTDWHLPSNDELDQLHIQKITVGGFSTAIYWSSSEFNDTVLWAQGFSDGTLYNRSKTETDAVRPVRAFGGTVACEDGGACAVGETGPGGGVVFYVAASSFTSTGSTCNTACKYLETAPAPVGGDVTRSWATDTNSNQTTAVQSPGATALGIGVGMANTTAIQAQTGNDASTSAAVYAYDYTNNSMADWYLPSKDELNELCKYARNTGQDAGASTVCAGGTLRSGFSPTFYWSSSEIDRNGARYQDFFLGASDYGYKGDSISVRPVRAF
jgi:hypothetical protein